MEYKIRFAMKADEPFLFEMLFQTLYVEEGQPPFSREILNEPKIARYVKDWGREGDLGVIAKTGESSEPIGAAWWRLAKVEDKGFAYLNDETPELGIALLPEYRGKGIGATLLKRLLKEAEEKFPAVSLSVSPNNPAMHLYERLGFEKVEIRNNNPVMLLKF